MLEKTYWGKRVLVTGDTGFKGSWLSLWLHELGAQVIGFALPPERENDHYNLIDLDTLIHHIDGNIRDYSLLNEVIKYYKPEFIFHLAAQSLVNRSYENPKLTMDTNISGSVNLLEAVRSNSSVRVLIYVTSDKCYKNKEWIWGYRETDELGGHDPYSASKAAAEIVFSAYMDSFLKQRGSFGAGSVRAGNVIGGGDWSLNRIVPDSIKSLMNGKPVRLRNPGSTRPWQHVLDPLYGYLYLGAKLYLEPHKYSGAWNFGPYSQSLQTVRELADMIIYNWGNGQVLEEKQANAPHEAGLLHLNSDKANHMLGWTPCWDFEQSVARTVEWYKGFHQGTPALIMSKNQIYKYMKDRIL